MGTHPASSTMGLRRRSSLGREKAVDWGPAALVLAAALTAAATGLMAGLGSRVLLVPVLALIGALFLLAAPTSWLLAFLIAYAMAVVGPAIYFFGIESARWLTPILSLGLLLPLVLKAWKPESGSERKPTVPAFIWVFALFLLHVAFTTIFNAPSLGEVMNAPRYYLILVGPVLLLMLGVFSRDQLERAWRALMWFTILQLPVAAIQHFVYAARKVREAPWDAVVGTFPGQAEGGGASHGLGVYLLTAVVFALALWRRGHLGGRSLMVIGLCAIGTVLLAEVKGVVLLIPVVLALVFLRELRRRPVLFLASTAFGLAVAVSGLAVYDRVFYQDARTSWAYTNAPTTALEGVRNQFNPERVSRYTPPSRAASFSLWWDRHRARGDYLGVLIGHGASSTQANRVGVGELARLYPEPLHQTTSSMLLWETGVFGHLLVLLGVVLAAFRAGRLARNSVIPSVHRAMLHAAGIALVLHALTLPYKSFVMLTAPSQVLLGLLLGYVAYWARQFPARARARSGWPARSSLSSSERGHAG